MAWLVTLGLLLLLGSGGKSSKPAPAPSPSPRPRPAPSPSPAPALPSAESVALTLCSLFSSTHAVAVPLDLRAAAYAALGTTVAAMAAGAPATHKGALALAERLYSGEVTCEPEEGDFAPSAKKCIHTKRPYNAARWTSPSVVFDELTALGFSTSPLESSDTKTNEIKRFQALARSLPLGGMGGSDPKLIDGIVGACTLVALDEARERRIAGTWPYQLVRP